jgi:dienelactone hydrolase
MKKTHSTVVPIIVVAIFFALSLTLILGVDSNWGNVEVKHMTLTSTDGDRISAMLYKPKTASAKTPAPCAIISHGGNDMLEQAGTYALELARRGYVVVTWDYTGCHNSDIATGTSETANGKVSGLPTMGAETVWNTVKSYNFVDFSKIVTMGHSMGGQYTMAFAIAHQTDVFLQVNLGMNNYGAPTNKAHNFNFTLILGDADESCLSRSNNNVASLFQNEQLKRIFTADYTSTANSIPTIKIGNVYSVNGTNGQKYNRTAYMPESAHAYYLVTQDAVKTVLYTITSQVGIGLDKGVSSYADHGKISTVWKWKDIGFILMLISVVASMFIVAASLFKNKTFEGLKLKTTDDIGFKRGSWQWYTALVILFAAPVLLYKIGILASNKFLGINISKVWLLGGTNNSYISWQWMVSLAMLAFFLIFHFIWGKKHGGNIRTYGFATSDDGKFDIGYIFKALLFGLITVGSGYILFALMSAYTQQGLHIATFMISLINTNRTLCILMYFLFQIPYFLTSSLAFKSIGITNTEDNKKGTLKSIGFGTGIAVGGLFLLWFVFVLILTVGNTLTSSGYFMKDRMYVYAIAILPLVIGMAIANALNIYICKKTNSIWTGLFTALLWGTWVIISTGAMTKYFY